MRGSASRRLLPVARRHVNDHEPAAVDHAAWWANLRRIAVACSFTVLCVCHACQHWRGSGPSDLEQVSQTRQARIRQLILENEEGDTFSVPERVPKTQLRQLHLNAGDLVHAYFKKKTNGEKWGKSSKVDEGSVEEIDEADGQVKIGFDDGSIIQTVPTGWIKDVIKTVFTIRAEAAEKRRLVGQRERKPKTTVAVNTQTPAAQKVETKTRVVKWHLHPGDLVHAYFKKKTAEHEDDVELVKSSKVDEGSVEEIDAADGLATIGFDDGSGEGTLLNQTVPIRWIQDVIKTVFTLRAEAAERRRVEEERKERQEAGGWYSDGGVSNSSSEYQTRFNTSYHKFYPPQVICPEFQKVYVESLPPPAETHAPWQVGRVRPRINVSWGWEQWALDHPLITPPRNSTKTPSGRPSYAHAPVGQRQASIRDSFCNFANMSDVFGGDASSFTAHSDMRRTAPLVKPRVTDDGIWRRQGDRGEWVGVVGHADSGWEEDQVSATSEQGWQRHTASWHWHNDTSSSEDGNASSSTNSSTNDPGVEYRKRYNEWLQAWDMHLLSAGKSEIELGGNASWEAFAKAQRKWEDAYIDNEPNDPSQYEGISEHNRSVWTGEHDRSRWNKRKGEWDRRRKEGDWDSGKRGQWIVSPAEQHSLPYWQEPYSYKAYNKYRKAHEEWPNRLYTSSRKQRKSPLTGDVEFFNEAPARRVGVHKATSEDNNGVTGEWRGSTSTRERERERERVRREWRRARMRYDQHNSQVDGSASGCGGDVICDNTGAPRHFSPGDSRQKIFTPDKFAPPSQAKQKEWRNWTTRGLGGGWGGWEPKRPAQWERSPKAKRSHDESYSSIRDGSDWRRNGDLTNGRPQAEGKWRTDAAGEQVRWRRRFGRAGAKEASEVAAGWSSPPMGRYKQLTDPMSHHSGAHAYTIPLPHKKEETKGRGASGGLSFWQRP